MVEHPWSLGRPGSQGWTVLGLRVVGRMYQPRDSLGPVVPGPPPGWNHHPQIQAGPLRPKSNPVPAKDGGPAGQEDVCKLTWSPGSWWWGSCFQPSSFGPPTYLQSIYSTLSMALLQGLGFVWEWWARVSGER